MSDYDGRTALHVACSEGRSHVVQYLLDFGAPVHVRDRYGDAPLDNAVAFRHMAIIKLLRQTGAHLKLTSARLAQAICKYVLPALVIIRVVSEMVLGRDQDVGDFFQDDTKTFQIVYRDALETSQKYKQ